jgi:hypothetical protein
MDDPHQSRLASTINALETLLQLIVTFVYPAFLYAPWFAVIAGYVFLFVTWFASSLLALRSLPWRWAAAASVVAGVGLGFLALNLPPESKQERQTEYITTQNRLAPWFLEARYPRGYGYLSTDNTMHVNKIKDAEVLKVMNIVGEPALSRVNKDEFAVTFPFIEKVGGVYEGNKIGPITVGQTVPLHTSGKFALFGELYRDEGDGYIFVFGIREEEVAAPIMSLD